jgi:lysophospholipase L1-like esterase
MDMYNHAMLDVCQQSGLECYDIASLVPKDTSAFYDEMHFNEAGARLIARELKQYLLSRPPFAAQGK